MDLIRQKKIDDRQSTKINVKFEGASRHTQLACVALLLSFCLKGEMSVFSTTSK